VYSPAQLQTVNAIGSRARDLILNVTVVITAGWMVYTIRRVRLDPSLPFVVCVSTGTMLPRYRTTRVVELITGLQFVSFYRLFVFAQRLINGRWIKLPGSHQPPGNGFSPSRFYLCPSGRKLATCVVASRKSILCLLFRRWSLLPASLLSVVMNL